MQASKMSNTGNSDAQLPSEDGCPHSFLSASLLEILIPAVEIAVSIQPKGQQSSGVLLLGEVPWSYFGLCKISPN